MTNIKRGTTQIPSSWAVSMHVPVGFWIPVKGVTFDVQKMPNRFHRLMMKLLLGWEFTDTLPKQQLND